MKPGTGTVLYVEDDGCDRVCMEGAFAKAGLGEDLQMVGNGQEAIDYLAGKGAFADRLKHPLPAVVLLDWNLPRVSGSEVLRWVRERPELAGLPVVVFSSSSREEDQVKARELGAQEFLEKPSSGMKFGEMVEGLRGKWMG